MTTREEIIRAAKNKFFTILNIHILFNLFYSIFLSNDSSYNKCQAPRIIFYYRKKKQKEEVYVRALILFKFI